ncbi:chemotaxis-specific protein-glutamate methyltransferase CheB [Natrarchaeobius halalkaliphilus]|uniref:Protein-glutamate methylesterase/protein-glutamine glutaminase n=1 Tax=Natrarchaeobius halalkaliphilus TaxID=1679091 RepID=A0A3N6LSL5_9EURY|nr:chemotaxis-specific protein-glutamate methyltransferase CheB [Natrarchaeobius halalkaliphilus]RQG90294.1 chemotaxis-specific protein-glutamate methyltransferase CheB [Natrarchaeobius halalkaliphilus]
MTRVLVVDDSRFMRTVIGNALSRAGYEVETAENGADSLEAVQAFEPDVVTMDVQMPVMDGIEAVERIMTTDPIPILMLSAYTDEGTDATLEALDSGAVDFLTKPDGSSSRNVAHLIEDLIETVDSLADADVSSLAVAHTASAARSVRAVRASQPSFEPSSSSGPALGSSAKLRSATPAAGKPGPDRLADPHSSRVEFDDCLADPTIVIGASTGGPKIVERLLERLPRSLEATGLVVQHMPAEFTRRFAERLDGRTAYDVREAGHDERIDPGEIVVAPGGEHLVVTANVGGSLRVRLDDGDPVNGVRPSIDVTMESVAEHVTDPICGVVLTGMGSDGAAGIEAISDAGGATIAQDEATSPVFGIPARAIQTGCVDRVAAEPDIADEIVETCTGEHRD